MMVNKLEPKQSLKKEYLKVKPDRESIAAFKAHLARLLDLCDSKKDEEFNKNLLSDFLKKSFYGDRYFINTKENSDLVIHNDKDVKSTAGVIFETKKPTQTASAEMPKVDNLNTKAVQQLVLYFLRERVTHGNLQVKHLVVTNVYEWFIFDAELFDRLFYQDKSLVKQFKAFEEKQFSSNKTEVFYKEIAKPAIASVIDQVIFTHFDLRDLESVDLVDLYKIFSPEHLLKIRSANDSNSLNKPFYNELLYIIGLSETKEGGKKLIGRVKEGDRQDGSLIENAIAQIIELDKIPRDDTQQLFDVALDLAITWVNRILFLKLLEAQLIKYHQGYEDEQDFAFLNSVKIKDYGDLNKLFFSVLALEHGDRAANVKEIFANVPYLNSSLFELTPTERDYIAIRSLGSNESLAIFGATVLTDGNDKKRSGKLNALEYLFEFLHAYQFNKDEFEDGQEDSEKLINASVLGLIFEKINGYKDGSFYTPSFITMYMCRETIRRAVVQKFNEVKGWSCENIQDLCEDLGGYIKGTDRVVRRNEANGIVNSLKICDPAVGSGHFLVSALNEMIAIKQYLGILQDRNGESLSKYEIEVVNDKLKVTLDNKLFAYNPKNKESQRVQETLFHEKQTIIEGCLFGVDINPNSVKICQLRLWIELLKNAYYRVDGNLETLPNIDINIKKGNSLISRFGLDVDVKEVLKQHDFSIEEYRDAVQSYRSAKSKKEKQKMESLIATIKTSFRSTLLTNNPKKVKRRNLSSERDYLRDQLSLFESKSEKKEREKKINKLNNEIDKLSAEIEDIESGRLYENALEWRFEFPEVLNDSGDFVGFDVVIGNPPYGVKFNIAEKAFLIDRYSTSEDIYTFFVELGTEISNKLGFVSFIIPIFWLTSETYFSTRNFICQNLTLDLGITLPYDIFPDAYVDTGIYVFSKNISTAFSSVYEFGIKEKVDTNILANISFSRLDKSEWSNDPNLKIVFDSVSRSINTKMNSFNTKFEDITTSIRGILASQEDYSGECLNIEYKAIFTGKLDRYCIEDENFQYVKYGENLREKPSSFDLFTGERILIRRIVNRKLRVMATVVTETFVTKKDIYIFKSINTKFSTKYLLAIINSKLVSYMKTTGSASAKKDDFTQLTLSDIRQLRVPEPNQNQSDILGKLVGEILTAKKGDRHADTSELEKECDDLVYQLYGLTEEEIKIVEGER